VAGEITQGKKTSEYYLTWAAKIIGVLAMIAGALAQMKQGDQTWALVLEIVGALQIALAQLGYTASRTMLKANAMKAAALVEASGKGPTPGN